MEIERGDEVTNSEDSKELYQIFDMVVQGVQELPADKSDKPTNEKMLNYYELRRKWIEKVGVAKVEALLAKQVLAARINEAAWWTKNYKNPQYKDLLINRITALNKKESQE